VDENTNARDTANPIVTILDPSLVNAVDPIVAPDPLNVTLPHKGSMATATTIVLLRVDTIGPP
jgi:hypothetical protein